MTGCGKQIFLSRRQAKLMLGRKTHYRTGGHMSTYWCETCVAWHIGHLGSEVISGQKTRSEAYSSTQSNATAAHLTGSTAMASTKGV